MHKGYKIGKQIEAEWFLGPTTKFGDKYEAYHKLRKYARGEHSVEVSKTIITNDEESSHTNYDFSPIQVLPKFKDILVNEMFPQLYNVEANAVDSYSTDLKNKERDRLMNRLVSKNLDNDMMTLFGIDMESGADGDRPNSEEEVDMRMSLEWKSNLEIASEEVLKYTFELNNYDETLIELLNDAVDIGRVGAWVYMHPKKGIIIERMDPAEAVWSYTTKRNHDDCWYFGVRKRVTISELLDMTEYLYDTGKNEDIILTEDYAKKTLRGQISEIFRNKSQATRNDTSEFDLSEKVDLLYYTYRTIETTYKKVKINASGVVRISEYKGEYKGEKTKGFDVIPKRAEVWKEGWLILGSPLAFGHKTVTNLAFFKEKGIMRIFPPAVMYANALYEGKAKGMIERCTVLIDKMQTTEIKIQQLVASAKPSGIRIDVSKINNIKITGGVMDYKTVMKIYNETGIEIYSSGDGEPGEFSQGNIHELKNGVVSGINDLVNIQNNYLTQLREALGLPQGVDASSPHPDTAVRVFEQVARSSNIATSHVLDSVLKLTAKVADITFERIKDIFRHHPNIAESYVKALGKINADVVKSLHKLALSDVGIFLSLKPDAPSQLRLEENISASLTAGAISLDDAQEAREIGKNNIKLASQLLRTRRIKREKDIEARENEKIELQGDQQVKLTEANAAIKNEQIEVAFVIQEKKTQSESEGKIAVLRETQRLELQKMGIKFGYDMQLEAVKSGVDPKTVFKEKEKMKRQDKNNTETSKVTEQRLNNGPAQDFTQQQQQFIGTQA